MANCVKVVNGNITQTYSTRKQYVDDNGVRYPVTIWQNTDYLKTQNLYKIQEGEVPNSVYYIVGGSTLSYDSVADTVNRSYTSTEKSTDTLKEYFKNNNLSALKSNLESTNYHIIRSQEDREKKIEFTLDIIGPINDIVECWKIEGVIELINFGELNWDDENKQMEIELSIKVTEAILQY